MELKKQQIIEEHLKRHKITHSPDGKWRTYVTVNGKQKLIAKTKEDDLVDYLFDFYQNHKDTITFEILFGSYKNYKGLTVCDNTLYKYDADYKRFFAGTNFEKLDICFITEEDCISLIVDRIKTLQLNKRAYEALYSYLTGCLKYAYNKHMITINPMSYIERKDYFRFCNKQIVNPKKKIVSPAEMNQINKKIQEDHYKKPNFITSYAVELAQLTGMRVGEISALRWDSIDFENNVIVVDKAEIFNQKTKEYYIGNTKNGVIRYIPITDKINELLKTVSDIEDEYGYKTEFVFSNKNGQIHKNAIGKCALNKSHQSGLADGKSIHCYRRTLNSKVKNIGMSTESAASIFGHTPEVNNKFYTFDVTDIDYKKNILEQAQNI